MKKIPVGHTIEQSYSFAFRKYLTILGIFWFPFLIMALLILAVLVPVMKNYMGMVQVLVAQHGGPPVLPEGFGRTISTLLLLELVLIYLYIVMRVGLAKEIMGLRTGPRFVYLSFGAAEFRVFCGYVLAFLLAYAVLIAVGLVLTVVAIVVGLASHFDPQSAQGAGAMGGFVVLLVFVFELLLFYGLIRLTFFIVPLSLAERKLGLFRSWAMTRGNFWRIFVILLAVWVPIMAVEFMAIAWLMGGEMSALFAAAQAGHPPDMQAILDIYMRAIPWFLAGGFVLSPVIYGLIGSPSVFAYLSVQEEAPQQEAA